MNIIDVKNFKFSNIPKTFTLIVKKISSLVPFIKIDMDNKEKVEEPKK